MRPAPSGRSHYLGPAAQRRNGTGHSAPNHDADANYEFAGQFDQKRRQHQPNELSEKHGCAGDRQEPGLSHRGSGG